MLQPTSGKTSRQRLLSGVSDRLPAPLHPCVRKIYIKKTQKWFLAFCAEGFSTDSVTVQKISFPERRTSCPVEWWMIVAVFFTPPTSTNSRRGSDQSKHWAHSHIPVCVCSAPPEQRRPIRGGGCHGEGGVDLFCTLTTAEEWPPTPSCGGGGARTCIHLRVSPFVSISENERAVLSWVSKTEYFCYLISHLDNPAKGGQYQLRSYYCTILQTSFGAFYWL